MYSLGIVTQAFLGIILTLDTWVYSLISSAYKIFMAIASARILSSDAYTAIANKVYVIIGVGMLFVLAYAIMKAIIDPDQMSKGDMAGGKILKSIAVAVIGLIVTPLLFDLAYMAQGKMLEDDILGKLFFRTGESTVESLTGGDPVNYDEELQNTGGAVAAVSVWRAFFYPVDGEDPDKIIADPEIARLNATVSAVGCAALAIGTAVAAYFSAGLALVVGGGAVASCITAVQKDEAADKIEEAAKDGEVSLSEAYVMVASGESFAIFQAFLDPVDEGQIRYTWFISTVCGAFVAYAFVSYAIDMGLRAAKLAYYQIIAPVPLILGVLPKNGDTVGKFAKGVLSTFMEVFVRISVVYIVVYIIAHLNELFSTVGALWDNENLTNVESLIAMALLIIGLVLFAKEAPKIIGETFGLKGDSGLKGLNIMDKLRRGEVFTAGTVAGTAIRSGVQGFRHNFDKKTTIDAFGNKHNRGTTARIVGGIGSAIGGAVSGGVRSGVGRARSGKAVGSSREMHDHIQRETDAINQRREQRSRDWEQNPGFANQISHRWSTFTDRLDDWSSGKVDLSFDNGYLKTASSLQKFQDEARAVAGKDPRVQQMKQRWDELQAKKIGEYDEEAYEAERKRRLAVVEQAKLDGDYVAAADRGRYQTDRAALKARLDAELAAGRITAAEHAEQYKQGSERLLATSGYKTDNDAYNAALVSARDSVRLEDFRYTADARRKAEEKLISDRKQAKDMYESTADAVFGELYRNGDAAAVEKVSTFVTNNINDFNTYANEDFGGRSLRDVLADAGIGLDGQVNETKFAQNMGRIDVTYKINGSDTTHTAGSFVMHDGNYYRYDPTQPGGIGAMVDYTEITDLADSVTVPGNNSISIENTGSSVNKMKSAGKKGAKAKQTNEDFQRARARQVKQNEKK